MFDPSDRDEIMILKTKQEHQEYFNEQVIDRLDSIDDKMETILQQLARTKGFVGGVIFTVTAIGSVIGAGATALWNHLASR